MNTDFIKKDLLGLVEEYVNLNNAGERFIPGVTMVPPSGKVIGFPEIKNMVEASLDGWLTTGRFNEMFEHKMAQYISVKHVLTCNSGSSANLLAFSALTSSKLGGRAIKPGDEVITVASSFPTTINPIIQHGAVPVFVDVDIPTYNIDPALVEAAVSPKTKAIMLAHTLGNPFNISVIAELSKKYNLWLIEDCCDALGSTYDMQCSNNSVSLSKHVGTFGDIGTLSFYPAHHITMGEGGAVFTNNGKLKHIIESFRDWGRDCYCSPGKDNTCKKRFCMNKGSLPYGYDHKYTYSHLGYNCKITDMQAACGLAQMDRLDFFVEKRKNNFVYLKERLKECADFLILPEATECSTPSWFGFPVTIKDNLRFNRVELLTYLEDNKIGTRLMFGGNIVHQPYFSNRDYRIAGELESSDKIMNDSFWLGVYPGIDRDMLDYMSDKIISFLEAY